MVQIIRDGGEIFYGEVREVVENIDKTKSVYCVGELAFLFDSIQPQGRYQNITPEQFLIKLVNIHNSKVEEKKWFTVGIVTVKDSNDSLYRYTNYEDTLTAIRKKLCEPLNGYLRIRKADGVRYLDLVELEDYGSRAQQPIQFGVNLLKYTSKKSASELATVCIPLGARLEEQLVDGLDAYTTIESVNDGKNYVINEEAYKNFGWVEKVVSWDDVTIPANLKKKAEEWIENNQYKILTLDLKAVDLAELEADMKPYRTGDMIRAIAEPFGMDMWFPLMKKTTYINESITNDVSLSYETKASYTTQQNNKNQQIEDAIPQESDLLKRAKINASEIIKYASAGNIHTVFNENGKPIELCIMDTDDITTAQKVWRWSMGGFGYSSTGYDGEYGTAITMDGGFVADYITTGILNAALIKAGILSDESGKNFWNMKTGEFSMSASAKIGDSTVASKQNVADAKQDAITSANNTMEDTLKDYSTTEEVNAAINFSAENLTVSFDKEITETKTYAKGMADAARVDAITSANATTNNKLKSYSTITEMELAVNASAESVKSEMSKSISILQEQIDGAVETFTGSEVPTPSNEPANKWLTDTEKDTHVGDLYMVNSDGGDYAGFYYRFEKMGMGYQWTLLKDNEITKALQDAKEANEKAQAVADDLSENYSTTTEMNSAIEQKADFITSTVAQNQTKWLIDEESYWVDIYGYGSPSNDTAEENKGLHYLDVDTGYLYATTYSSAENRYIWTKISELETIQNDIYSKIEQNAYGISQKVSSGEVVSEINQSADTVKLKGNRVIIESDKFKLTKDGHIEMLSGKIKIEGSVTKYASDYTQDDVDTANRYTIGLLEVTAEALEKYDVDGDGRITTLDAIIISKMVSGEMESYTVDTSIEINPQESQQIIKTSGVQIGVKGIYGKSVTAESLQIDECRVYAPEYSASGYAKGQTGEFYAGNAHVRVDKGIITGLFGDGEAYTQYGNWRYRQLGADNVYEILYFGSISRGVMSGYGALYFAPFELNTPFGISEVYNYSANIYSSLGLMGIQLNGWTSEKFSFYLYSALPEEYSENLSFRAIVKAF